MEFTVRQPESVEDAVRLLASLGPRARAVLGGSDVLVAVKDGTEEPEVLVDLTRIAELAAIAEAPGEISIGAGASLDDLRRRPELRDRYEVLAMALATMGSVQLRRGASIGGNVVTASPAADTAPPLLVLEAELSIAGPSRRRRVPIRKFFLGPRKTALEPGEVLVAIHLPRPPDGARSVYLKHARRQAVDLALVSAAAIGWHDGTAPSGHSFRIALGAVAPTPIRVAAAEEVLRESHLDGMAREEVRRAVLDAVRPIDDVRATAAYRREMAATLALRAVDQVMDRLAGGGAS